MPNRSIPLSLLIGSAAIFVSGTAFAGFEWVPPAGQQLQQQAPAATNDATLTPPPAVQAPLEPVAAQPLMPVAPAVQMAQPVAVAPLPSALPMSIPQQPVAAAPILRAPAPQPAPAPILQKMPAPQPVQAQAREPQQPVFLKVKKIAAPAPVVPDAPLPVPVAAAPLQQPPAIQPQITWNPAPAPQEPIVVKEEPFILYPAPAAGPMEEDLPQISRKLVINPYPQKTAGGVMPALPAPAPGESLATSAESFSVVEGFGSDMPLAIALQQIAPPDYVFSFGDNVNPGVNISWDGEGRPWNQVITSVIAPLGLEARIDGKTVHIASNAEQQGMAIMPQAGEEMSLTESDMRRSNVTDPGESPKKQPLSTPVASEEPPAVENPVADSMSEAKPLPLLPEDATAAPQAASETTPVVIRGVWEVHQGDSLKETLDSWSKKANVELVWNATHDYTVESDMTMNDSFQTAVQAVVAHGVKTDKPVVTLENDGRTGRTGILTVQDKT